MRKRTVLVIGETSVDVIVPYGRMKKRIEAIKAGDLAESNENVPQVQFLLGGGGSNVASIFAKLGAETRYLTHLGNCNLSRFLANELIASGVNMDYAIRDEVAQPFLLAVIDESGEKTMLQTLAPGSARVPFTETELRPELLDGVDALHITGTELVLHPEEAPLMASFAKLARSRGILVSFDLNLRPETLKVDDERRTRLAEVISAADIILGSKTDEFCILANEKNTVDAMAKFATPSNIVVGREGAEPVLLIDRELLSIHRTLDLGPVINTTGAGDSFSAGFVLEYLETLNAQLAVFAGNAVAGVMITSVEHHTVPSPELLEELINRQAMSVF